MVSIGNFEHLSFVLLIIFSETILGKLLFKFNIRIIIN